MCPQYQRGEVSPILPALNVYTCTCTLYILYMCGIHHTLCILYAREMQKEERSKQARSYKQQGKLKQHNTPKAITFPKKNELPQVEFEPTYT